MLKLPRIDIGLLSIFNWAASICGASCEARPPFSVVLTPLDGLWLKLPPCCSPDWLFQWRSYSFACTFQTCVREAVTGRRIVLPMKKAPKRTFSGELRTDAWACRNRSFSCEIASRIYFLFTMLHAVMRYGCKYWSVVQKIDNLLHSHQIAIRYNRADHANYWFFRRTPQKFALTPRFLRYGDNTSKQILERSREWRVECAESEPLVNCRYRLRLSSVTVRCAHYATDKLRLEANNYCVFVKNSMEHGGWTKCLLSLVCTGCAFVFWPSVIEW